MSPLLQIPFLLLVSSFESLKLENQTWVLTGLHLRRHQTVRGSERRGSNARTLLSFLPTQHVSPGRCPLPRAPCPRSERESDDPPGP